MVVIMEDSEISEEDSLVMVVLMDKPTLKLMLMLMQDMEEDSEDVEISEDSEVMDPELEEELMDQPELKLMLMLMPDMEEDSQARVLD